MPELLVGGRGLPCILARRSAHPAGAGVGGRRLPIAASLQLWAARRRAQGVFVLPQPPRFWSPHVQGWRPRASGPQAGILGVHAMTASDSPPAVPAWGPLALCVQTTFRASRSLPGCVPRTHHVNSANERNNSWRPGNLPCVCPGTSVHVFLHGWRGAAPVKSAGVV
jgi:hypothetical protein